MANVPMTTSLELNCSAITVRAAFSHVFLFRELATLFAGPPSDMESQPSVAAHPEDHPEESSEIAHSTSEMEPIPTEVCEPACHDSTVRPSHSMHTLRRMSL